MSSEYLDEVAREAGIKIERYNSPLDIERTKALQKQKKATTSSNLSPFPSSTSQISTATSSQAQKTSFHKRFQQAISLEDETPAPTTKFTAQLEHPIPQPTAPDVCDIAPFNPQSLLNLAAIEATLDEPHSGEQYSYNERQKRAGEFFDLIETRLVPQLKQCQTARESTAHILHDLEQLRNSINALQLAYAAGQKTMETKVDLGCKILADAKFVNNNKIVIDLGLNIWAEMTYEKALEYIDQRHVFLLGKLEKLENDCCLWSARIKAMHEAIGVLSQITEQDDVPQSHRNIAFGM